MASCNDESRGILQQMCPFSPRHGTFSVDLGTGIETWIAATKVQSSREPQSDANPDLG